MKNFENVQVNFKVYWQFKELNYYKVTKCKKIINCRTGTILKQCVKGGSIGYYIGNDFIKRKDLNNNIELIPKKEYNPF